MRRLDRLSDGRVLVLGRAGMDLYADPPGTQCESAERFFASLGGSAGNIAAGLARQGVAAAIVTTMSDDAVGRFVRNALARYGVALDHARIVGGEARTSLAVTETRLIDTQTVIYRNRAADFEITEADIAAIDLAAYGGLIVTGTALAGEPSRQATLSALEKAERAELPRILDLDYRPYSWASQEEAADIYRRAAAASDMIIGNVEEFDVMAGGGDGRALAQALAQDGRTAVYKMGEAGSDTFPADEPGAPFHTGIFPVQALKPMGAGDAFMAALVAALCGGTSLQEAVVRGSAAAAIVVAGIGCAPAMPSAEELADFLRTHAMVTA